MPKLLVEPLPHFSSVGRGLVAERRDFWQRMARTIVPDAVFSYDQYGAPVIENSHLYISVSHSLTAAAVMVSTSPCGVDAETPDRNFHRVADKYISPEEATLCTLPEFEAVAWCAKEAMYKIWRKGGYAMTQFRITSFDPSSNRLMGVLPDGAKVRMSLLHKCGNIVVTCTP